MKHGKNTLAELAVEIERQAESKRDVVVPFAGITITPDARMSIAGAAGGEVGITDIAHGHLSEQAKIDRGYYRDLQASDPELLSINLNRRLSRQPSVRRMVRMMDGNARAVLSPSYRPLDNFDLLKAVLPVLRDRGNLEYVSGEVTERRMYLKLIAKDLTGEVKAGDVIRSGLLLSNSEVGAGRILAAPFSERLVCTNGATHMNLASKKNHIGRMFEEFEGNDAQEFISDDTRRKADEAFFSGFRDIVAGILSAETFEKIVGGMREAIEDRPEPGVKVEELIEAVAVNFGLTVEERSGVLTNLLDANDGLSRFSIANAVTRTAQDADTYDRASELEQLGGDLMTGGTLRAFKPIPVKARRSNGRTRPASLVASI